LREEGGDDEFAVMPGSLHDPASSFKPDVKKHRAQRVRFLEIQLL
jgi:hypothetical protein